jgi:hypothetical protein
MLCWCHRAARLEAIVHQHLPIFHTEHCVFCRFLSSGDSHLDCGHPCESNALHLRDGSGRDHLVLADEGCRNTVFNAQAQSGDSHGSTPTLLNVLALLAPVRIMIAGLQASAHLLC